MASKSVGAAPVSREQPPCETYSPVLLKPRVIAQDVSISPFITSVRTCPRCLRTAFVRDGEGLVRCINCALPQKYAVCACGHGLMAHVARGGCEAATDNGEPCPCQERSR
jgi:hypothetical protein